VEKKDSEDESDVDNLSNANAKSNQAQTMKGSNKELPPAFMLENHNMEGYLWKRKITGKDIEKTYIRTKWQIQKIKVGF
jgi:hypothetical protein